MSVLNVSKLEAGYGGECIVRDISFSLKEGEILGLVGASGSGKSTVFHSLLGIRSDLYIKAKRLTFEGRDLLSADRERAMLLGKDICAVFQHASFMLVPSRRIRTQFEELGRKLGMDKATVRKNTLRIFKELSLNQEESIYAAYPFELSGGQKQRVGIALALLSGPKVLLCDEPTSAVDAKTTSKIMQVLLRQRDLGCAILLITHNLNLAAALCSDIAVLRRGEIVEQGETKEILRDPKQEYTKKLLASVPKLGVRIEETEHIHDHECAGGCENA